MRVRRFEVTFLAEAGPDDAASWYRAWFPASCVSAAVVVREIVQASDGRLRGVLYQGFPGVPLPGPGAVLPASPVVVLRRPDREVAAAVRRAREVGQLVYVDLDDDVWHLPAGNPARATMDARARARLGRVMRAATGVLVPTEGLAATVREVCPDTPVHVVPSGILPADGARRRPWDEGPRVGWMGTVEHRGDDLATIARRLRTTLLGRGAPLWWLGAGPARRHVSELLPDVEVVEVPWVTFPELAGSLREIDVLVIPQRAGWFAESRSPTTGLAAAAAGTLFWAQPTGPYLECFGRAGLPEGWNELLEDAGVRARYRARQTEAVGRRGPEQTRAAYEKVFADGA